MPKKFKGENSKSAAARERKTAAKDTADQEKRLKEEEDYWKDEDKHVARRQERKVFIYAQTLLTSSTVSYWSCLCSQADKERKKQEQQDRKHTAKLLLEEEEAKIGGKSRQTAKVTRAQIIEAEEQQRREKERQGATSLPRGVVSGPSLEPNPNHLLRARMESGEMDARTVEEAIDILSVSQEQTDRHPERRIKAAYAEFEERELTRLKAENPNMRLSQIKQLLKKEWMKSPDNPMNR